jgi:acetyl-CoA carboxylase biotin carboxyl carrier protein
MTDATEPDTDLCADLRLLRSEVSNLVKTIPGQVASVSLRAGQHALEITWAPGAAAPVLAPLAVQLDETPGIHEIVAPLVGTFYIAPEPGAAPFVRTGDRVEAGQTVGIVEAMKLLNPVSAEFGGEVVDVLVGDAEPVEFGQGLVRIRADAP